MSVRHVLRSVPLRCVLLFGGTTILTGCATHGQTGALVGSGFGAATGAIIGSSVGHAGGGALIGAATGALAGGALGSADDAREERDAALYHAAVTEQRARELHNVDLIRMTQSGLGEDVIIGAVQSQGGSFDLSPDGLIALKTNGVSDRVITSIQSGSGRIVPVSLIDGPPPVVPVVVVPPRPRPHVEVILGGPRHHRHCPPPGFHFHHEWHH